MMTGALGARAELDGAGGSGGNDPPPPNRGSRAGFGGGTSLRPSAWD
jgi:hypothetical protein